MSKKKIIRNIASLATIQVANFVMPLISVPVISRILGPEHFGLINFIGALIMYFNLFIGYGFNLTATRKLIKDPENITLRNKIFSEVLYCQILLFIVSMILFAILLYGIPTLSTHKKVCIYAFLFCISSVLTQNWIFQAMQDLSKVAVVNLLGKIIYLVMVITLINTKEDYYWQPLSLSLTQIIVGLTSFFWAKNKYHLSIVKVSLNECFSILVEGKAIFLSIILTTLYTTANIVVLGLLQNQEQVGYYTAGQKLITVAQTLITLPLSQVFFPHIGRSFAESIDKGVSNVQKLIPPVILTTTCLAFAIIIIGPYVLKIFYGELFLPAIPVFQILAFVPLFNALNNILGVQLLINLKLDKIYFKVIATVSVLSTFLNIYMSHNWSYIGCALNWIFTEIIICVILYLIIKSKGINLIDVKYLNRTLIFNRLIASRSN